MSDPVQDGYCVEWYMDNKEVKYMIRIKIKKSASMKRHFFIQLLNTNKILKAFIGFA